VGAGPVLPKPAALTGADVGAEAEAIGASVPQGVALNDRARSLGVPVNDGHGGLIIAGDTTPNEFDLPGGPRLTVLHPNHERLERLRKLFEVTAQEHGDDAAVAAAMTDTSVPNLSSIVILASAKNATMLLTGDARGDDVLAGLDKADKLDADKGIDVDILKVPHHGSDRNVDTDFFRRVRAAHYVISGDGTDDNPENATLQMIIDARGDAAYTVHLTNRDGKKGLGPRLATFLGDHQASGHPLPAQFRESAELSLVVNLGDPLG
jgi:hypothetical protein